MLHPPRFRREPFVKVYRSRMGELVKNSRLPVRPAYRVRELLLQLAAANPPPHLNTLASRSVSKWRAIPSSRLLARRSLEESADLEGTRIFGSPLRRFQSYGPGYGTFVL